jgi:O-antigen/teichoic acid export membrane protein
MSRTKRFALSLVSGYVQLAVNSLFTIVSVRLALAYLPHDEYALWMPVTVIATYIALMDFGLSSAASRILIDYKDHEKPEEYGSIIQTTMLVGLTQAALISVAGVGLAFVMGPLLKIPDALQHEFFWLVVGQCAVTAGIFGTRIVLLVLSANQRFDIGNYSSALALILNCAVMWVCFARGAGVYSLVWGQAAGVATTFAVNWLYCVKLNLFPQPGRWGRPTWEKFRELFAFGRDVFLFTVGLQFISVSQTLLLTRFIGLDAALVWGICTRGYVVLVQVIGRVSDFSSAALAEMIVRGEREKLLRRVRELAVLSVNMAVAAGAIFAVANGPFVDVWTKGSIHWTPWNDLLLAAWLVVTTTTRLHLGLVGITKAYQFLRYLVFIEGLTFIGLTILLYRHGGITIMLTMSILCSFCFTTPYGLNRTRRYFNLRAAEMAQWHRGTAVLALVLAPAGFGVWWFTRSLGALPRLCVELVVLGPWTAWMFIRFGMGPGIFGEACDRLPSSVRPMMRRFGDLVFGKAPRP